MTFDIEANADVTCKQPFNCKLGLTCLCGYRPNDVTVTQKYTEGLQVTKGTTISTRTKIEVALTAAVDFAPFSASTSITISHEIEKVNTHAEVRNWSKEVQTQFTFPANQDCSLYQRRIKFVSEISGDDLVQTPADFPMVCSPIN